MAVYELKNGQITVLVDSFGAELKSLKDHAGGTEFMWQADPAYWKRTSPVLFPLVGTYRNNETVYKGKTYSLPQHGFARDMEFTLVSQTGADIRFVLEDTQETRQRYPFAFRLEIGYRLKGSAVEVSWRVENPSETGQTMYFSIGGHPAFCCPLKDGEKQTDYALLFDTQEALIGRRLGSKGVTDTHVTYPLADGRLDITEHLFDHDALIIENHQAHKVSLVNPQGRVYLTVAFDAPLFGIWSPPKKQAPFICIEPWYGRADHERFAGGLKERAWGNVLEAGEAFVASYQIITGGK